jgi:hypothetical protein
MKRLTAVLAFVALIGSGGAPAWAQQVDPLALGFTSPGALEGSFITESSGQFQFLILGSPRLCNDGSDPDVCPNPVHLWFYTAACSRVDDAQAPLTENDVEILELHSPFLTSVRTGNVLVATTPPSGPFDQPILGTNSILGLTYYIDVNRGIGRIEELARLSNNNGNGWSPYKPIHVVPFALPDDGGIIFNTLLIRCPRGTAVADDPLFVFGDEGTLGGDMLDLAAQDEGFVPGSAYSSATSLANDNTICDDCDTNGLFARALTAIIFDLDENFLRSVDNLPCQCIGVAPQGGAFQAEVRMSTLAAIAGVRATYWELFSFGAPTGDELFTGALNTQLRVGSLNLNFFTRLHNTNRRENIIP